VSTKTPFGANIEHRRLSYKLRRVFGKPLVEESLEEEETAAALPEHAAIEPAAPVSRTAEELAQLTASREVTQPGIAVPARLAMPLAEEAIDASEIAELVEEPVVEELSYDSSDVEMMLEPVGEQRAAGESPPPEVGPIFRAAGVSIDDERELEHALALCERLPRASSEEVQREIVDVTLQTFGHSPPAISNAVARALTSLEAHLADSSAKTEAAVAVWHRRLEEIALEETRLREQIQSVREAQSENSRAVEQYRGRVAAVARFFAQPGAVRPEPTQPRPSREDAPRARESAAGNGHGNGHSNGSARIRTAELR
jgi:hypothetical protein